MCKYGKKFRKLGSFLTKIILSIIFVNKMKVPLIKIKVTNIILHFLFD
jgi:hypothetical protein